MLAIVETGGKQYEVFEGKYVDVELLDSMPESEVVFDKVVMVVAGEESLVGAPYVEDASVKGKILEHGKSKKIIVYKQRPKKGYRRKQGHRQEFSRVMIEEILCPNKETILAVTKPEEAKEEKKSEAKPKAKKAAAPKKSTAKKAEASKEEPKTEVKEEKPKAKKAAAPKKTAKPKTEEVKEETKPEAKAEEKTEE